MKSETEQQTAASRSMPHVGGELLGRIEMSMQKAAAQNRSIFIVMLKIENLAQFRKKRPEHVVNGLLRELYSAVRMAVHPSQYVSIFGDGLALVFDAVDAGKVDTVCRRLVALTQHVIRAGKYNDLTSRWTDIISQFLWPNNPGILYSRVGWAIFPRDGSTAQDLVRRASNHVAELSSR